MRRSKLLLPALGALALAGCSADRPEPLAPFAAPGTASRSVSALTSGRYILASNGGFATDLAARVAALGGTLESVHAAGGIAVVSGISDAAAAQLSAIRGVNDVEPDLEITLGSPLAVAEADASSVDDPSINSQTNPASAGRYNWQWNMRDIKANVAWAAGKLGSPDVKVAILDTGIGYDSPDLNGLVDDASSTSFVPSDNALAATYFVGRKLYTDFNGHGTNVATQVSSKAVALAGVSSRTTLMAVKVLGRTGSGSLSGVLNGILWAADHGADVANMSLGVAGGVPKTGFGAYVSLVNRTFNYAKSKGTLMVVSAGNDAGDLDHNGNIFAAYCDAPHVVCVSSVGPAVAGDIGTAAVDAPAYFTNFGRSAIAVAAPGGNADAAHNFTVSPWPWGNDIASWVWSYCPKDRVAGLTSTGVPVLTVCTANNRLSGFIGTSQASPHVTGLAALLVAEMGHGQPSAIKNAIQNSADDLGQPGTDPFYGRGRINVAKALGLQ
jgi:subtilisin family serine protease